MKILVVRFSSIGDIVLTTPVLRCLKEQLNATIHYLTKSSYRQLLVENPNVDQIFTIQKEITEILPSLKKERYDFVVDLHHNLRTFRLKLALGVKSSSFPKLNVQKWLLTNFKINRLPNIHIVDRYMETVSQLGVQYDGKGLDFFITEKDRQAVKVYQDSTPYYIVFAIGGKFATKRLPKNKLAEICQNIQQPIILIGGTADSEVGESLASLGSHIQNTCGALSLTESAALIEKATCLLAHDTGMMHIGAALGKDMVTIWGNTVPEFGMTPYFEAGKGRYHLQEVQDLACRPCSKIGYGACPKGHFRCMDNQNVAEIVAAVNGFLATSER